jgi:O-antigen ligase
MSAKNPAIKSTAMVERKLETAGAMKESAVPAILGTARLPEIAHWLVVAVAISLPWSTSVTSILLVLWLIAILPTFDVASVRREVMTAAGGLPVLLWGLGALGMLWADASWTDRLDGHESFHKLLFIPFLLAQFRRSGRAKCVLLGFVGSALVLLIVSWGLAVIPGLTWRGKSSVGVPVKDYIVQSGIFALCAFGLIGQAAELWQRQRMQPALLLALLAAIFVANILYVATARTTIVVMAVLLVLFGFRFFRWRGVLAGSLMGGVLAGLVWTSSPYMRERVTRVATDIEDYRDNINTPVGLRLEFWRKSLDFIAQAPLSGHGTGTITMLFRTNAAPDTDPAAITTNPHSQILAVAIQLGLIGTLALIAMWIAQLALFHHGSLISWFGLIIVSATIVSSFFNSHLFDFSHGWLYVIGVGIAGGAVLHRSEAVANVEYET